MLLRRDRPAGGGAGPVAPTGLVAAHAMWYNDRTEMPNPTHQAFAAAVHPATPPLAALLNCVGLGAVRDSVTRAVAERVVATGELGL
jgi:hypothetical protein